MILTMNRKAALGSMQCENGWFFVPEARNYLVEYASKDAENPDLRRFC